MAVPVVASSATATDSSVDNNFTVDKPSGVVSGDVLYIISCQDQSTGTTTTPTGFSLEGDVGGGSAHLWLFSRRADGSEASTFTLTTSGNHYKNAVCLRVTGVDAGVETLVHQYNELDDSADTDTGHTSPSITTSLADCLVLSAFVADNTGVDSMAAAGGETEVADVQNPGFNGMVLGIYSTDEASAGSVSHSVTLSPSGAGVASMIWAINAAEASASTGGGRSLLFVG